MTNLTFVQGSSKAGKLNNFFKHKNKSLISSTSQDITSESTFLRSPQNYKNKETPSLIMLDESALTQIACNQQVQSRLQL
ncbi:hypothetical protein L596_002202 [Steinernema carpocapsae]|uniref:Uncharacterized protein n=1 Tax=Steinernema carpocapsae TaxID=34508 RepID=A0A4U8USH6_STECR|nr:hypothetical protein L596_002202 [Steinernema carpocapsae]